MWLFSEFSVQAMGEWTAGLIVGLPFRVTDGVKSPDAFDLEAWDRA